MIELTLYSILSISHNIPLCPKQKKNKYSEIDRQLSQVMILQRLENALKVKRSLEVVNEVARKTIIMKNSHHHYPFDSLLHNLLRCIYSITHFEQQI